MPDLSYTEHRHYTRVAAILIAGDVQARVVSGDRWTGVEVKQDGQRIYWANVSDDGSGEVIPKPWGWTVVDRQTGKAETGRSHISPDAPPEDVALCIATMYDTPQTGPTI